MNYFAHGRAFLDDPYFLAGTAVPDWLNVIDRRMRVRSKHARPFVEDEDPCLAAVARGIVQHHHDDDWFHQTRAFAELSLEFARRMRQALPADEGFRPSFLGHIVVELLLDGLLAEEQPAELDRYYAALTSIDAELVQAAVNQMATATTALFPTFLPRFLAERFLYDYAEDAKLLTRLNHVLRRVQLPQLPAQFAELLGPMRADVRRRQAELLASPSSSH
jgi:hypothetical protein